MRRWLFGDNGRAIALPFLFIYTPTIIQNSQFIIVITAVNCGLLLQLTRKPVNSSTTNYDGSVEKRWGNFLN